MSEVISYRGPDDFSVLVDGDLGLAHRRLSIIDLTSAGRQPMCNGDGSLWVVFNGEIYNYVELIDELKGLGHTFRTRTDTEVILHAYRQWGPDCVQRFNGMWAFAIWDQKSRKLFCSRDRFGIKPFYYSISDKHFIFGSEIKAILYHPEVPRQINSRIVHRFLVYHVKDEAYDTCFQGIQQLPPGHNLAVDRQRATPHQYWNVEFAADLRFDGQSDDEIAERFRALLVESIRLRLRSDVPVGMTLSGGLDSSSIAALTAEVHSEPLHTYSVNFPGTVHDESKYVDALLQSRSSLCSHVERPDGKDVVDVMEKTVWHQDEPCWAPAVYSWWHVMRTVSLGDVTVILNGQAADELLAGYPAYYPTYLRQLLRQGRVIKFWRELNSWSPTQGLSIGHAIKLLMSPIWPEAVRRRFLSNDVSRSYDNSFFKADFSKQNGHGTRTDRKGFSLLAEHLQSDFTRTRLPELLHAEDRFSMAFSLESRVPFLDHRLVEFSARLPDSQRVHRGVTKVVLRNAMCGRLPEITLDRRDKMGYPTPGNEWLKTIGRDFVQDLLHSRAMLEREVFDVPVVQRRFDRYCQGTMELKELWRLISTEVWFRTFIDPPRLTPNRARPRNGRTASTDSCGLAIQTCCNTN
jgi:asparagine synthase (glutamine-hydrolysing)